MILFESVAGAYARQEIREFEITAGGREWSFVGAVAVPPYCVRSSPVALLDGSRILWLANATDCGHSPPDPPLVLLQYEMGTGRTSIVDIGRFASNAVLLADQLAPRVFVVEGTRVVAIDERLRVTTMHLPGALPVFSFSASAAGHYLVVQRGRGRSPSDVYDAVVIDTRTGAILRTVALEELGTVRVSRAGVIYLHYYCQSEPPFERCLDARSVETGELLARVRRPAGSVSLLDVDDSRGVVVTFERSGFVGRDLRTLVPLGEIWGSLFDRRSCITLQQTRQERAILVYSTGDFFDCLSPRIDVFDGDTFVPIKTVDLRGRCPVVLAVPPR